MRGVVLPGDRRLEIRDFPVPQVGHGQVLLRMKASAMCGSDLRAIYRPTSREAAPKPIGALSRATNRAVKSSKSVQACRVFESASASSPITSLDAACAPIAAPVG